MDFQYIISGRSKIRPITLLLSLNLMAIAQAGLAMEKIVEAESDESLEKSFIDTNIAISRWFDRMAEGIDLFLAGKRLTAKKNDTSLKLENTTFSKEGENVTNTPNLNLNLRLPNTEEYWNLKFTSYDDSKEKRAADTGTLRRSPRERDYGASIGLFQKLGRVRTAFQPRVSFSRSLKISHSLSFESVADLKTYEFNPKLEFFGNADDGTGIFLAANVHQPINATYSLTYINDGEYVSRSHVFSASNGISLRQGLTRKTAFSYGLMFDSNNQTNYHLESYSISVSWYHLIYKNILDYQIVPFLEFARAKNFRATPGIVLVVSLNF